MHGCRRRGSGLTKETGFRQGPHAEVRNIGGKRESGKLLARVLEQVGEVVQAARIFEAGDCSVKHQRPVLAFAVEQVGAWGLRKGWGDWAIG